MKLSDPLFQPLQLGDIPLANRVVMAPMTRSRAAKGDLPPDLHVAQYRDRASAGLIITEGTQPSADGKGYCRTSGLHDAVQVEARSRVTAAVHGAGRRIVAQLMHAGRIASHHNNAPGGRTVASSALRARGRIFTDTAGMVDFDTPHALAGDEILAVIDEQRGDAWGGSAPRRRRFVAELDAFGLARLNFNRPLILNDDFDGASARSAITQGTGEAVSFARHFIGKPDPPRRLRDDAPLSGFHHHTLYTPGATGYNDYPPMA